MTSFVREDGSEGLILLHGGDDVEFELVNWCDNPDGINPIHVHFIIQPAQDVKVLYRFTGPKTIGWLIHAFIEHYEEIWGEYNHAEHQP